MKGVSSKLSKPTLKKGDVYFVKSDDNKTPIGSEIWSDRPAVIVSNDTNNKTSPVIQVVYLTNSHRRMVSPMHVALPTCGVQSIAMCEQIHTIDISRLDKFIAHISPNELNDLDKAISFTLGIEQASYKNVFRRWESYIRKHNIDIGVEQERLIETTHNQAIENLRKELEITRKERDSYKDLSKINEIRYEQLKNERKE